MIPMRDSGIVKARHERGSAVVERNRFRADQMNAAVDRGQIYRRAAFAELAVEALSDRKIFFRLAGKNIFRSDTTSTAHSAKPARREICPRPTPEIGRAHASTPV